MQVRGGKYLTEQPEDVNESGLIATQSEALLGAQLTELSQSQRDQISEVFILFDQDKDGLLGTAQLATVLRALGFNPSNLEIQKFSTRIDPNKSGYFGEPNLVELVMQIGEASESFDDIVEALKVFEKEGAPGKVEVEVLKEALLTMGEQMNEDEFSEMLNDGDLVFGNLIDIYEFAKALYNRGQ